jgi:hypothetical protein
MRKAARRRASAQGGPRIYGAAGSAQHADLAQHSEQVQLLPVLNQPSVPDAMDVDAADGDRAAGGRHAGEGPGMGSGSAPPGDHLVVLGHLIVHRHYEIREGGMRGVDRGSIGLGPGIGPAGDMAYEGGIKQAGQKLAVAAG